MLYFNYTFTLQLFGILDPTHRHQLLGGRTFPPDGTVANKELAVIGCLLVDVRGVDSRSPVEAIDILILEIKTNHTIDRLENEATGGYHGEFGPGFLFLQTERLTVSATTFGAGVRESLLASASPRQRADASPQELKPRQ